MWWTWNEIEQLADTNIIRGRESYTFRIIVGELLAWLLFVSCSVMCNVMVPRVCPSQPRWVPHVTGSPWLITIIKWRDLRERQSFPIPGQAVTPCHTSQPPSSAPGRVTEAIRSKVAPRRWERDNVGGIIPSSSDAADHPQCESCHCLTKAFYSHTITITSPWSLLPFPHPGPRLIEGQVRGARWGAQPAPGDILWWEPHG